MKQGKWMKRVFQQHMKSLDKYVQAGLTIFQNERPLSLSVLPVTHNFQKHRRPNILKKSSPGIINFVLDI